MYGSPNHIIKAGFTLAETVLFPIPSRHDGLFAGPCSGIQGSRALVMVDRSERYRSSSCPPSMIKKGSRAALWPTNPAMA